MYKVTQRDVLRMRHCVRYGQSILTRKRGFLRSFLACVMGRSGRLCSLERQSWPSVALCRSLRVWLVLLEMAVPVRACKCLASRGPCDRLCALQEDFSGFCCRPGRLVASHVLCFPGTITAPPPPAPIHPLHGCEALSFSSWGQAAAHTWVVEGYPAGRWGAALQRKH